MMGLKIIKVKNMIKMNNIMISVNRKSKLHSK